MRGLASKGDSPLAYFSDDECETLFTHLNHGTDEEFLSSATTLAQRLVGRMDRRSRPGLLACLRAVDGSDSWAAVLKLEVVAANAAVLRLIESGEMVLAGAKDVLNAPGDLQKGAVVNDPRPGSSVIIGDKLVTQAAYFPAALGITTQQRPKDAVVDVITALAGVDPQIAQAAVKALPDAQSGPVESVLEEVSEAVPSLTPAVREVVVSSLRNRPRPVETVDTSVVVKTRIRAGGVTIILPATDFEDLVDIQERPEGGWRITIIVDDRPMISNRR